jgi:lipoyl-dependent peroxiredoxin
MLERKAVAVWRGTGLEGSGALTTQSEVLRDQPYSVKTRFQSEDGKAGTNPEELLAAAHAGCFSISLSFLLTGSGHPPQELRTTSHVRMDSEGVHYFPHSIQLVVEGKIAGISLALFEQLAEQAKKSCPISQALAAVPISLTVTLVS